MRHRATVGEMEVYHRFATKLCSVRMKRARVWATATQMIQYLLKVSVPEAPTVHLDRCSLSLARPLTRYVRETM